MIQSNAGGKKTEDKKIRIKNKKNEGNNSKKQGRNAYSPEERDHRAEQEDNPYTFVDGNFILANSI